jgi:hypothetical protein
VGRLSRWSNLSYNESPDGPFFRSLYDPDGSHPSLRGTYLASVCFYTELVGGADPRNSVQHCPTDLGSEICSALLEVAAAACPSRRESKVADVVQ